MKIPEILIIRCSRKPGSLASILSVVANHDLSVEGLKILHRDHRHTTWEVTIDMETGQESKVTEAINRLEAATVIGHSDRVFDRHQGGKIEMVSKQPLRSLEMLRDIYTPGVARVCLALKEDPKKLSRYTAHGNTVAIVTNGTAVLGLGDIGAQAGLPVMEGKAALLSELAGLSGIPILTELRDVKSLCEMVVAIAPSFGAIQIEDVAAPECFELEEELMRRLDIPVLCDDRRGTAVVVLAALLSAARIEEISLADCRVGQIGLGAAGLGVCELLLKFGVKEVLGSDLNEGALNRLVKIGGRAVDLPTLMRESDVVIATTGVKDLIKPEWIHPGQFIFALSNPEPEIDSAKAIEAGARFATDGRIVNNVLGFPGIFKGALAAKATVINDQMLLAAAAAISTFGTSTQLVPDPLDRAVHSAVRHAVMEAAAMSGVARS